MFMFQAQLCFVCSNPSNARRSMKDIKEELVRFQHKNWAIIEIQDQSKHFGAPDILHVVHLKDTDVDGCHGKLQKSLAETKGSWLYNALTSQSLYLAGHGTYFVFEEEQGVLRSAQTKSLSVFAIEHQADI